MWKARLSSLYDVAQSLLKNGRIKRKYFFQLQENKSKFSFENTVLKKACCQHHAAASRGSVRLAVSFS